MTDTRYTGKALVVEYGTLDLSGQYTVFEWKATQGEVKREDVSDKSSSGSEEFVPVLLGDKKTTWSIKVNDVVDGTSGVLTLDKTAIADLVVYPEGKFRTYPMITIPASVIDDAGQTGGYGSKVELSASGYSFSEPVFSAYDGPEGDSANGIVLITCWDGNVTDYTEVFARLKLLGMTLNPWPATSGVFATAIAAGAPNDLNAAQAVGLSSAGWNIVIHGNVKGDDYAAMTYGEAYANMYSALTYLAGLGTSGNKVLAPSGGLDAESWPAFTDHQAGDELDYCIWQTGGDYLFWPKSTGAGQAGLYYGIDWQACADANVPDFQDIADAIDLCIGNPKHVCVLSMHRIVAAGPVGSQVSYARLNAIIAYLQTKSISIKTVTGLE